FFVAHREPIELRDDTMIELAAFDQLVPELRRTVEFSHADELTIAGDDAFWSPVVVRAVAPHLIIVLETKTDFVHLIVTTRATSGAMCSVTVDFALACSGSRRVVGRDVRWGRWNRLAHQPCADELAPLCGTRIGELRRCGKETAVRKKPFASRATV